MCIPLIPPIASEGVIWEVLRVWHSLATVFRLLSVCFLNGLVLDGYDNTLQELLTESLKGSFHVAVG
jgi:hypothetical protein